MIWNDIDELQSLKKYVSKALDNLDFTLDWQVRIFRIVFQLFFFLQFYKQFFDALTILWRNYKWFFRVETLAILKLKVEIFQKLAIILIIMAPSNEAKIEP